MDENTEIYDNVSYGLIDALKFMRGIYFSSNYNEEEYKKEQHKLALEFKSWLFAGGVSGIPWWIFHSDKIRPLTLALFKTFTELFGKTGIDKPVLKATLNIKDKNGAIQEIIPIGKTP